MNQRKTETAFYLMTSIALFVLIMLACSGCMSTKTVTTSPDGSVTQDEAHSFFQTIGSWTRTTRDPSGVESQSTMENVAGDVALARAIGAIVDSALSKMLLAQGATNTALLSASSDPVKTIPTPAGAVKVKRIGKPTVFHPGKR